MKIFGILCIIVGGFGLVSGELFFSSVIGFSAIAEIKCGLILGFGCLLYGLGSISDNLYAARALITPPASTHFCDFEKWGWK